jgi:hypothetical protein
MGARMEQVMKKDPVGRQEESVDDIVDDEAPSPEEGEN